MAAFEDGMLSPAPGSQAEHDFALALEGPAGRWPDDVNIQPRALAAKLVRQQADYCTALGHLVGEAEVFDPLGSLLRGAFEYGTRAIWVIDPRANVPGEPGKGHRVRSARTLLMELASTHHAGMALSGRVGVEEERASVKATWKVLRALAQRMFADVRLDGDPTKWSIEGVSYSSWTTIAQTWGLLEGTEVPGGSIYQLLALEGHPQGFTATRGLRAAPEGPTRTISLEDVTVRVQLAVGTFYSSFTLLANYHGYRSSILERWEHDIDAVLPGALRE